MQPGVAGWGEGRRGVLAFPGKPSGSRYTWGASHWLPQSAALSEGDQRGPKSLHLGGPSVSAGHAQLWGWRPPGTAWALVQDRTEAVFLCSSPALSSDCGLWEVLAHTLGRLSPAQAGPLALGVLKLQDW